MHFRALNVQIILLLSHISAIYTFVLMESDSKGMNEADTEDRILYLIKILQKVKELTDPGLSPRQLQDLDLEAASQLLIDPRLSAQMFTDPESSENQKPVYLDLKDMDIRTLANTLREAKWPLDNNYDNNYERVIDIQKKDFAILPPSSEWCRMMGFRRCRNGATS